MKKYITNPDGTELWCCPHGECNIQWLIKPKEIGPPEFISRDGYSENFCHSFMIEITPTMEGQEGDPALDVFREFLDDRH
jgi:hypothetical protein